MQSTWLSKHLLHGTLPSHLTLRARQILQARVILFFWKDPVVGLDVVWFSMMVVPKPRTSLVDISGSSIGWLSNCYLVSILLQHLSQSSTFLLGHSRMACDSCSENNACPWSTVTWLSGIPSCQPILGWHRENLSSNTAYSCCHLLSDYSFACWTFPQIGMHKISAYLWLLRHDFEICSPSSKMS